MTSRRSCLNIFSASGDAPTVSYVPKGVHDSYAQFPEAAFTVQGLQDGETTDGLTEWSGSASAIDPHYEIANMLHKRKHKLRLDRALHY